MPGNLIWVIIISGVALFFIVIALSIYILHAPPTQPNVILTITGLNDTYKVGQRINFSVSVIGESCDYPSAVFVQDLRNNSIVWLFNGTLVNFATNCPAEGPGGEKMYSTSQGVWYMHWSDSPIIIHQPGSYRVVATFYNEIEVHRHFRVVAAS
jgi:hypothetical protein